MAGRLSGKHVVVTGGASGIGAACARRSAEEAAASVTIADLDEQRAVPVLDQLRELGCRALFVATDVSRPDQCRSLVDTAVASFGRIDVLVGAAGISHAKYRSGTDVAYGTASTRALLVDVDLEDWHRVIDVNLNGLMYVNQAVARHMLAAGVRGAIVNIASMNAVRASVRTGPYSVSKAGAWMLTKTLALELAEAGIRVNAVGPGFIDTPMNTELKRDADALERIISNTPLGHLGEPIDIANAVLYLASDESAFVTGTLLCPDGGFIAATR